MRIWKLSHGNIKHFGGGFRERLWDRRVLSIYEPTSWGTLTGYQSDLFREIRPGDLVVLSQPVLGGSAPVRLCVVTGRVTESADGWLERKYLTVSEARVKSPYRARGHNWAPNANTTCWEVPQEDWGELDKLILKPYFNLTVEKALRAAQKAEPVPPPDDPAAESKEGRRKMYAHLRRERSGALIKGVKARALRDGTLQCEACSFDFKKFYGEIGSEFIEAHHKVPLARLDPRKDSVTKASDIALLCANCHRMVHRRAPWLTVEELKRKLHRHRRNHRRRVT